MLTNITSASLAYVLQKSAWWFKTTHSTGYPQTDTCKKRSRCSQCTPGSEGHLPHSTLNASKNVSRGKPCEKALIRLTPPSPFIWTFLINIYNVRISSHSFVWLDSKFSSPQSYRPEQGWCQCLEWNRQWGASWDRLCRLCNCKLGFQKAGLSTCIEKLK